MFPIYIAGWAHFDDVNMETGPTLSTTDPGPQPWVASPPPPTTPPPPPSSSDNWANFESDTSNTPIKVPSEGNKESWAAFSNIGESGNVHRYVFGSLCIFNNCKFGLIQKY
jgi:hypothetical protein